MATIPTSHGSQQLRLFRRAIRDGETVERACELSGIDAGEARFHLERDAADPPPPEAFMLIGEEMTMARGARKAREPDTEQVQAKDFDRAKSLYFNDIKPARTRASGFMQEVSTAFKAIKKACGIQPGAMKAAVKVVEMEDAHRDDWLRCFNGVLRSHNIDPDPKDMVDMMQAEADAPAPAKNKRKPDLVVVGASDGSEPDLAEAGGAEAADVGALVGEFDEATDEELAAQAGRGSKLQDDEY